ncbi:MAG: HAMP domain-containing histidine kinase [Pleurocapsa sp. SU_196_0]|nr:HAMP domain-containing histidine kinase [Pleurocapsa sp. SU_196_0]
MRENEAQQRAVVEAQRRFVADAAHELRAPLTAIQGNLELLERYPNMPSADKDASVHEAAREARRLARLAQDMLSLARGDAGLNLELHPLEFSTLLGEAVRDARHLAQGRTLEVSPLTPCVVSGHGDRLRQLMLVLIDNALKYTPSGGRVGVEQRLAGEWVTVCVTDDGPGIAPQDLSRVFERFYRAEGSRNRETGGTGLGLPIAKWITEQHGGQIWLESEIGRGTTAIVKLPLLPGSLESSRALGTAHDLERRVDSSPVLQDFQEHLTEILKVRWFHDEAVRAAHVRPRQFLRQPARAEDHERNRAVTIVRPDAFQHLETRQPRQVHVNEHESR